MEAEIAQLEPAERDEFLEDMGLTEPGLDRLIHSAYALLTSSPTSPPACRRSARGPSCAGPRLPERQG